MITDIDYVKYEGIEYPVREVFVRTYGVIPISTSSLNNSLFDLNGSYRTKEAMFIDERICYYVKPEEIYIDENELRQLLENELDVESESA